MSTTWRNFGKCLDGCGAEPGTACRNDDDEVSETPCAGRPTLLRVQRPIPPKSTTKTTTPSTTAPSTEPVGLVAFNDRKALAEIARLVNRPIDGLREHAEIIEAIRVIVGRKP